MKYSILILLLLFVGCKADDNEYFFVTYYANNDSDWCIGSFEQTNNGLPNMNTLIEIASNYIKCNRQYPYSKKDITITGIYKFKDSAEYSNFYKGFISNAEYCQP